MMSNSPLEIDVTTLKAMMDARERFMLLDVREKDEHARSCIQGSRLIPLGALPSRAAEVTRDLPLVVHCHHGGRSMKAVTWLRQNGFSKASNLVGGIDAWSVHIDPMRSAVLKLMRILAVLYLLFVAYPVHAESLQAAMVRAYQGNPILQSGQARLRAIDEGVPLAKSGSRPSFDFNTQLGKGIVNQNMEQRNATPRGFGFSVTQPVYKGGRIDAGIDSAEKSVLAERAALMDTEQSLFLNVATSYVDVWRDQATVKINRKNEDVLRQELQAARDRFKVGEATRTDVAQADSRFAGATASRIESEGRLANSKATYEKITGDAPSELAAPDLSFPIPKTLDDTIQQAQERHPKVINARFVSQSAEHDIDSAQGALLPEINVEASADRNWETASSASSNNTDSATITARLTLPLYRSGADYARTRAAKETASQRRVEIRSALDNARETAVSAWESLKTAQSAIQSRQKQLEAAELAFEGVKEESKVGTRTILDRLNAEAEALQARVNLVQAQRDKAVALFSLKAAIGELTADNLNLPLTPYDPAIHYDQVKDAWIGLGTGEGVDFPFTSGTIK